MLETLLLVLSAPAPELCGIAGRLKPDNSIVALIVTMECAIGVQQNLIVCWIMIVFPCGVWAFSGPLTQWGLKPD
eukprot:208685-Ditylum_brightwellii.AAC.1